MANSVQPGYEDELIRQVETLEKQGVEYTSSPRRVAPDGVLPSRADSARREVDPVQN